MRKETIRRVVKSAFEQSEDTVISANLIRKTYAVYSPGLPQTYSETAFPVRLISMLPPKGKASLETGPVLNKAHKIALLQSEESEPIAGDHLQINDTKFVLQQVISLDHGAGILFEVWYQ